MFALIVACLVFAGVFIASANTLWERKPKAPPRKKSLAEEIAEELKK